MKKLLLFIVIFSPFLASSQVDGHFHDFETWYRFKGSMSFNDQIDLGVSPGLRFNENSTEFKNAFIDLSASYKVNKYLKSKLNLRLGSRAAYDRPLYNSNRVSWDVRGKIEWRDFQFSLRNRVQFDFDPYRKALANRIRGKITYDMSERIKFYSLTEAWFKAGEVYPFSRYRVSFGFDIKLKKRNYVNVFYMRQSSVNDRVGFRGNIIGLTYDLEFKSIFK